MDNEERQHLDVLLQTHRRNLRWLEYQAAKYGSLAVPVSIISQIEDEQAEIVRIERLLEGGAAPPSSQVSAQQPENRIRKIAGTELPHKRNAVWMIIMVALMVALVVAGGTWFLLPNLNIQQPSSGTNPHNVQSASAISAESTATIAPNAAATSFVRPPATLTILEPSTTPSATTIPLKGHIAFISDVSTNPMLYIINPDGSGQIQFAAQIPSESKITYRSSPAWSPDGKQIALALSQGRTTNIYIMNADGSYLRQLTDIPGENHAPAWSPDGKHIAFRSHQDVGWKIFVIDANGDNMRPLMDQQLTTQLEDQGYPSWSPDSKYITFEAHQGDDYEIYTVNLDNEELRQLTANKDNDGMPSWSPDGQHIAFACQVNSDRFICVMNTDGSGVYHLAPSSQPSQLQNRPTWSPDSQYIAFSSERDGNVDIYRVKVDGTDETRITSNAAADFSPAWSP